MLNTSDTSDETLKSSFDLKNDKIKQRKLVRKRANKKFAAKKLLNKKNIFKPFPKASLENLCGNDLYENNDDKIINNGNISFNEDVPFTPDESESCDSQDIDNEKEIFNKINLKPTVRGKKIYRKIHLFIKLNSYSVWNF